MQYVDEVSAAIGELLPLFAPIARSTRFTDDQSFVLGRLSAACLRATDAALLLVEQNRIWESEVILRTVAEGTMKMVYLLSSVDEFQVRYVEFTEALPDIAELRSHERAKEALASLSRNSAVELKYHRQLILPEERERELRDKYPRALRQQIEQRWSFSELINALSQSSLVASDLFKSLLFGYWAANQVAHVSFEGIMMAAERQSREPIQRSAVNSAHCARVASDCYSYCAMRLHTALKFIGADLGQFLTILSSHSLRLKQLQDVFRHWRDIEMGESRP